MCSTALGWWRCHEVRRLSDGLHQTDEGMQNWFRWIKLNRPALNHYSIFEDGKCCGESFLKSTRSAALNIKLFGFARELMGATAGLSQPAIKKRSKRCRDCMGRSIQKHEAIVIWVLGFSRKTSQGTWSPRMRRKPQSMELHKKLIPYANSSLWR